MTREFFTTIRMKITLFLLGILVFCGSVFGFFGMNRLQKTALDGIDSKLFTAAEFAKELLPDNYHERITGPASVSPKDFDRIVDRYNHLCTRLGLEYLWSLLLIDGKIVFTTSTSPDKIVTNQKHAKFFEVHSNPELYTNTFATMKPTFKINIDKWGRIRVALIPFKDSLGRPYLFGASVRIDDVESGLFRVTADAFIIGIIILILMMGIVTFITGTLSGPIVRLTQAANKIAAGDYGLTVKNVTGGSSKEIASLANSLNRMSLIIREKMYDLKHAEELYRTLVESSPDGITVMGLDGTLTFASLNASKMMGMEKPGEGIGRPILDYVAPEDRLRAANNIAKLMKSKSAAGVNQYTFVRNDGSRFQGEIISRFLEDADGKRTGILSVMRDITERVKTEAALRQSEINFRLITELSPDVIFENDAELRYTLMNKPVLGLSVEDYLGKTDLEIFNTEDAKTVTKVKKWVLENGKPENARIPLEASDGSIQVFEGSYIPKIAPGGKIIGLIGYFRNVTEKNRLDNALRESERSLKEAQKMACLGNYELDIGKGLWTSSEEMDKIFGIDDRYIRSVEGWANIVHPADRQMMTDYFANEVLGKAGRFDKEYRIIRRNDGMERWVYGLGELELDVEGRPIKMTGTIQDITGRKLAEEELLKSKLITDNVPVGLHLYHLEDISDDRTLCMVYANPATLSLTGLQPKEVIGKTLDENFPGLREKGIPQKYAEVVRSQIPIIFDDFYYEDNRIVRAAFSVKAFPLPGNFVGVVFENITDRKKAEETIEKSMNELVKANDDIARLNESLEKKVDEKIMELREKDQVMILQSRQAIMGEMLRNIAHQWRQPLNALGITIQNIKEYHKAGKLDEEFINRSTEKSVRLLEHMSRTIDDFRNFFKPDKEKCPFRIADTLNRTLEIVEQGLTNNFISLEKELDESVEITGYPNEYGQVLMNLINNAKDVLMEKKVDMPLITIKVSNENGRSLLTISDNGGGISTDIIGKVFDPYFTTKSDGTGIGLYMSKIIIEKNMGGKLTVVNRDGGAEFRIII